MVEDTRLLSEREYAWSCTLMRIAIWGLTCGAEKSSQRFRIILQPAQVACQSHAPQTCELYVVSTFSLVSTERNYHRSNIIKLNTGRPTNR